MDKEVIDFLNANKIGCLSTDIGSDIHGAAVHYTYVRDTNSFYIQTNRDSRKCTLLRERGECSASFVVGFSEEEWKTYQADGRARLVTDAKERGDFSEIRLKQYPGEDFSSDPEVAFIEFTPSWWRYTDFNTKPKKIIEIS